MKKQRIKSFGVQIKARPEEHKTATPRGKDSAGEREKASARLGGKKPSTASEKEPATVRCPDLPYRILYVSDLIPDPTVDRMRISTVDKNSFASLLERLAPTLEIDVPNVIGTDPRMLPLKLRFTDMNTFRPEGIIAQVPPLARLMTVRSLLAKIKEGSLSLDRFREEMIAAGIDEDLAARFHQMLAQSVSAGPPQPPVRPPEGKPVKNDRLDSLLEIVSLTPEAEGPPVRRTSLADSIIAAAGSLDSDQSAGRRVDAGTAGELIRELESIVSEQLTAILHNPEYRQLEKTWRGLKFLVDRMDFRKNLRLAVLPSRRENMPEALQKAIEEETSRGESEGEGVPVSLAVADYSFGCSADDLGLLGRLAETAAQLQLPVAGGADPSLFGKTSMSECAQLPLLWQHFQEPQYIPWSKFRESDPSAFLALTLPTILLRSPYGSLNPVKGLTYVEPLDGENSCVWGCGSLVPALAAATSVVQNGWPTDVSGMNAAGRIENLPVWETPSHAVIPLSVLIPESKQIELAESGFCVLSCSANSDAAFVAHAPVVHRSPDGGEGAIELTFAYRLLAARVLRLLGRVQPTVSATTSRSELKKLMAKWVADALGGGAWQVRGVESESGDPRSIRIKLEIVPPSELLGGETILTVCLAKIFREG